MFVCAKIRILYSNNKQYNIEVIIIKNIFGILIKHEYNPIRLNNYYLLHWSNDMLSNPSHSIPICILYYSKVIT